MTDQNTTAGTTSTDLANDLRVRLAELGTDVDQLPDNPSDIATLLHKLSNHERDQLCELITLRLGRSGRDWPKWLDRVHDQALESDAIDAGRKTLAEHLDAIISEVRAAQRARAALQGHGTDMWDVEHAEGGQHFEHALKQLAFFAAAAKELNPTRDM